MNLIRNKYFVAIAVAAGVVLIWIGFREYNTRRLAQQLDFDFSDYKSKVSDSTNWNDYEPLSLEIPQ